MSYAVFLDMEVSIEVKIYSRASRALSASALGILSTSAFIISKSRSSSQLHPQSCPKSVILNQCPQGQFQSSSNAIHNAQFRYSTPTTTTRPPLISSTPRPPGDPQPAPRIELHQLTGSCRYGRSMGMDGSGAESAGGHPNWAGEGVLHRRRSERYGTFHSIRILPRSRS